MLYRVQSNAITTRFVKMKYEICAIDHNSCEWVIMYTFSFHLDPLALIESQKPDSEDKVWLSVFSRKVFSLQSDGSLDDEVFMTEIQ